VLRPTFVFLLTVAIAVAGCTRVEVAEPTPPPALDEGGAAGQPAGGVGSTPSSSGQGGDGERGSTGGDPGALELGVWPTFDADPARSRDVQAVSASVAALSAGSMTLPLAERWDALTGASGAPRTAAWAVLDAMIGPYRERRRKVALCIGIVEREQSAWPFADELDSEAARLAMERTIDEAFGRYGSALSHLCFGYELDRYWSKASPGERERLLAFLAQSVAYASVHPLRGRQTAIGAAVTLGALGGSSPVPLADLLLGDEVVAVYDPLDDGAGLKEPAGVVDELSAALSTLESLPGPRLPLSLFEVGYPSAESVGSSEAAQSAFYDSLFGALDSRRDELSFVGVYGLGDRSEIECEAEAPTFGAEGDAASAWAAARCSMGLRAGEGEGESTDKPAWQPVLAAMSRYR
jgi:hypothetical protein